MYEKIENDFIEYISYSRAVKNISVYKDSEGMGLQVSEYKNRWAEGYKNRFLKKLYRLQDWYETNSVDASFVTFTTRHQKTDFIPFQINDLRNNFLKIKDIINRMYGKVDYIGNMDFHADGFAHYHFIFFCQISESNMNRLKEIWSEKYGLGSFERGIHFETVHVSKIDTVAGYVFRHSAKLFDFKFERPGSLRFNACVRFMYTDKSFTGVRFFSCSRHVSQIMKLPVSNDQVYLATAQQYKIHDDGHGDREFRMKKIRIRSREDVDEINNYLDYLISI